MSLDHAIIPDRKPIQVSILLVNYNTREMTLECLRSIYAEMSTDNFEIIVVDNDSKDGSAEAIATEFPEVMLLAEKTNHGFGRATNIQARHARGEFILLLNTDTVVLDQAIDHLLKFAENNPAAGIWGGRTLSADGSLNPTSCWGKMTLWSQIAQDSGLSAAFPRSRLFNPRAYPGWERDTPRHVDIVTGCLLMIRRDFWTQLGGFDHRFFMYGEETDLCLRAIKAGARPMITPAATIIHYDGGSTRSRAQKTIATKKAERAIFATHFSKSTAPFAMFSQKLGVLLRAASYGIASTLAPTRYSDQAALWRAVWARRREWTAA